MSFYITTPLFYVNDLPHIGSAYPTIACDFLAGHMLQRGEKVAFLTGSDEHGQKIEKAAQNTAKTPIEHCDFIAEEFQKLWQLLDIHNDYFVRTSSQSHYEFVTEFFEKVRANGDIYKGEYKGLYCPHCEDFWLEKDLDQEGEQFFCPVHKKPVEEYSQENYFFALSKYESKLKQYIEDNPDFIQPEYRKNEVLGWIKEGLKDFPISRANISWGIPVPGDKDGQVIYVWFDALLGYISGLGQDRQQHWSEETKIIHIIGKDILRFHAVYWPAMLMSAGFQLPYKVFGHGFLTKDGMKMGKTLGNIIDPVELTKTYGKEALKFYFLREIVFGRDGDYTESGFIGRLNTDLANNLGNLLNRALKLVSKYFDNKIPEAELDTEISQAFELLHQSFIEDLDNLRPFFALEALFKTLDKVNAYINDMAPWKLLKSAEPGSEEFKKAASSLVTSLDACRRAAIYLAPIMPSLSQKIFANLGLLKDTQEDFKALMQGQFAFAAIDKTISGLELTSKAEPIFLRIEEKKSETLPA